MEIQDSLFDDTSSNMKEKEMPNFTVRELGPAGSGEGKLSHNPEKYPEGLLEHASELIRSQRCMAQITEEDDGCMDGRHAIRIAFPDGKGHFVIHEISEDDVHERAKMAGAGPMTGTMANLSAGKRGAHIDGDIESTCLYLAGCGVCGGSHTGPHGSEEKTDCGGNDAIVPITENGVRLGSRLEGRVSQHFELLGEQYSHADMAVVTERWHDALESGYFEGSTGVSRLGAMRRAMEKWQHEHPSEQPHSVVKDLDSDHQEAFIVYSYVEGYTFSQKKFRDLLHERYPEVPVEKLPEVFVLDIPRIQKIARAVCTDQNENLDTILYQQTLTGTLLYQEAALTTLEDGSMPRFVVMM